MKKWLTGFTAAGLAALFPLGASAASPATGEAPRSPIPFILAGIGLVLVIAMVVLTSMSKKKQGDTPPPEGPQPPASPMPPQPPAPSDGGEAPENRDPSDGNPPVG